VSVASTSAVTTGKRTTTIRKQQQPLPDAGTSKKAASKVTGKLYLFVHFEGHFYSRLYITESRQQQSIQPRHDEATTSRKRKASPHPPKSAGSSLQKAVVTMNRLPRWAKPGVEYMPKSVVAMTKSSVVPLALLLQEMVTEDRFTDISKLKQLSKKLFTDLESCVSFPTPESRKCVEARRTFSDAYSEANKDLPVLYDAMVAKDSGGFYFEGIKGEFFDDVGPRVDIGHLEPFPLIPAAKLEWARTLPSSYLDAKTTKGFKKSMVFTTVVAGQEIEVMHLKDGLCVPVIEHKLLKSLIQECITEDLKSAPTMKLLFSNIGQVAIRMIWPGRSHKVFSDPRGGVIGRRAEFHQKRIELATSYLNLLWDKTKKKNKAEVTRIAKQYKKNPPKNPKKTDEGPAASKKNNWPEIIKKHTERIRVLDGKNFASSFGFGADWFINYYSKGTQEKHTLPGGQVKFFDKFPKSAAAARVKKQEIISSSSDDDDDDDDDDEDDDDESGAAPAPPPKKVAKPTAKATTSKAAPSAHSKKKAPSPDDDDDDDFVQQASKHTHAPSKKKAPSPDDDFVDPRPKSKRRRK
jgi:hypothetical protein